jgi:hypothetical protein
VTTVHTDLDEVPWDRIQTLALIAGGVGLLAWLLALAFQPTQFFASYLVAYVFWAGIALGCLALLMVQYLTGGLWAVASRRVFESGAWTLLPLGVLFLPFAFGMAYLYPWANPATFDPQVSGYDGKLATLLQHKAAYLNVAAFWIRTVLYFAVWLGCTFLLLRWSIQQESDRGVNTLCQRLSAIGLVFYGLTVTLAAVDWTMSLEPSWYSTIYPVLFGVSQLLSAFAFTVALIMLLSDRPPFAQLLTIKLSRDLGSLLFAFLMLWAYMSISQLLLIWSGNLREEIPWYLRRSRDGWQWVAGALAVFHFALPFFLLLFRSVKQNPRIMIAVAGLILAMQALDIFWWVEPAFSHTGYAPFWLFDLAAWVGLGGVWLALFLHQLRRRLQMPGSFPLPINGDHHA